jgi:membrane-associated phospholipid phosphatase
VRSWGAILFALAGILAAGRVFLGLHYPSDVLAGAIFGAAIAAVCWIPPIRRRLDGASDAVGRLLDRAIRRPALPDL